MISLHPCHKGSKTFISLKTVNKLIFEQIFLTNYKECDFGNILVEHI